MCKSSKTRAMCAALFAVLFVSALPRSVAAQGIVHALIRLGRPRSDISNDFSGLSFEMKTLLPGHGGKYFFRPSNTHLIRLFKTLGIHCLRVGGNTADLAGVAIPDDEDIDSFFHFAKAADVKVIYTLRLRGPPHPRRDARIAGYIMRHYAQQMLCFAIGNEPNLYDRSFAKYRQLWRHYVHTILKSAPTAKFDGPSSTGSGRWAVNFVKYFGHNPHVILLTQHTYVGGSAWKVKSPALGRDELLSRRMANVYRTFNLDFGRIAAKAGMPFRLEETNSFYNGGAKGVSDTFASALWGLDYMWWWAQNGCNGLNFHTGNWVAAGPHLTRCRYAIFWTNPTGVTVHPLGYAMEAFNVAAHGRFVPVHIIGPPMLNMTAYGTLAPDGDLYITAINKTHGGLARSLRVTLRAGAQYVHALTMTMRASNGHASAESGVTLGDASFNNRGEWRGRWKPLRASLQGGLCQITVPATSAVIVKWIAKQTALR